MLSSAIVLSLDLSTGYRSITASKSARESWKNSAASVLWPAYAFDPSDLQEMLLRVSHTLPHHAISKRGPSSHARLRVVSHGIDGKYRMECSPQLMHKAAHCCNLLDCCSALARKYQGCFTKEAADPLAVNFLRNTTRKQKSMKFNYDRSQGAPLRYVCMPADSAGNAFMRTRALVVIHVMLSSFFLYTHTHKKNIQVWVWPHA
jgi:hypothetical protein